MIIAMPNTSGVVSGTPPKLGEDDACTQEYLKDIIPYIDAIPGTMRSSLLIDLQQGKRIEVEALQGTVVRRGAARGVPTPIMSALYSVLKLHAQGSR